MKASAGACFMFLRVTACAADGPYEVVNAEKCDETFLSCAPNRMFTMRAARQVGECIVSAAPA